MIERIRAWVEELFDPYPYVRRAVVHTRSGRSIEGVLWRRRRGFLVIREARLLEHGKEIPLDGDTIVERANVDFIQVLGRDGGQA